MGDVLTALTVFTVWALLGVLAVGLLLVFKALQSIRGWFQKVVVGVRAVEQHVTPLGGYADTLSGSLDEAVSAIDDAARRLEETGRLLQIASGSEQDPSKG